MIPFSNPLIPPSFFIAVANLADWRQVMLKLCQNTNSNVKIGTLHTIWFDWLLHVILDRHTPLILHSYIWWFTGHLTIFNLDVTRATKNARSKQTLLGGVTLKLTERRLHKNRWLNTCRLLLQYCNRNREATCTSQSGTHPAGHAVTVIHLHSQCL